MSELDMTQASNVVVKDNVILTEYVVLTRDAVDNETWFVQATLKARSGEAAIRSYLGDGASNGTYVAVPARSWRPVTVKAEQTTTLKLEQAT